MFAACCAFTLYQNSRDIKAFQTIPFWVFLAQVGFTIWGAVALAHDTNCPDAIYRMVCFIFVLFSLLIVLFRSQSPTWCSCL